MNEISIQERYSLAGYALPRFVIDGKHLYDYITDWLSDRPGLLNSISPVDDLEIAWTDEYDFEGDARFMRFILQQDRAITPILSCPDDFDFSCIVIVADVIKLKNTVLWKRIGKAIIPKRFSKKKNEAEFYIPLPTLLKTGNSSEII